MVNKHVPEVKNRLKNYPLLKARHRYLLQRITDKKELLRQQPAARTSRLSESGASQGSSQSSETEHAAMQREQLEREIEDLEVQARQVQSQISQIETAVNLLGSAGQLLKDRFFNRYTLSITARTHSLSIHGCRNQLDRLVNDIAIIMYGGEW